MHKNRYINNSQLSWREQKEKDWGIRESIFWVQRFSLHLPYIRGKSLTPGAAWLNNSSIGLQTFSTIDTLIQLLTFSG